MDKNIFKWKIAACCCLFCLLFSLGLESSGNDFLPSGLAYVWWHFDHPEFEELQIDFEIHKDLPDKPGIFLQFYQGKIGDTGFYFGFQTDIHKPGGGKTARGIIFSRWGTRDLKNVRTVSDGWSQSAGYEGDFVGIRKPYNWTNHRYRFRLAPVDFDHEGAWYGVFIFDFNTKKEDYAGALRFPKQKGKMPKIRNGGGTWAEIYSHAKSPDDLPCFHMSVNGAYADFRKIKAEHASSDYSEVKNTDIFYDPQDKRIHIFFGKETRRAHPKGLLF